ncbi:tRNA (adenosine(37)-N6)-threonylcarbamoyltransferase complex dimerization subunit type 1 TsaB [Roseococcus sp. SYP-B2431]|uniref:tRNA (adenosine(37)-N6)-threonylcarbamoyltransferase complex dimerization subunit type 1 TsaB n=1 Tax=Roseococcus sp. SYP-B2431 TaxID=2496640 RepID=UPI00103B58D9|nr:tRNA (adenosine(37)-N6)-threonylcarbamoyltransferase complex dimerization subunit type 1 TsaB [Roseococcus sp. SYP-B2431]TCH96138.1 tRNA (adenosine(37)-N6)-threonylcarbamoyltransferase complex dimerization subunit type 1 TsaB [Roseococcus sp. SYP-B2431]
MRLLVLDAALSRCLAALVEDGTLRAERVAEGAHGQASALPPLAEAVLEGPLDAVAVGVGPGSFTGLRSAIALAQGIAAARGIPLVAVTTGEALAAEPGGPGPGVPAWAVTENRRGQLFLERFGTEGAARGGPEAVAEADLPRPDALIRLVGDGAPRAAARMAARGWPVALGDARQIGALALAAVARRRLSGGLPPRAVEPAYVEPPATT